MLAGKVSSLRIYPVSYRYPLFELDYGPEEESAVQQTLQSGWISMGPKTREFELAFANHTGAAHCVALSSCTAALHLSLLALGVEAGSEIIVPSLTFAATANAVRYVGAIPVFADIYGRDDLTLDPHDVEKKITDRTKGIIVMHYAGFSCDMKSINRIAKKYDLHVIEDAAHAPDSEFDGCSVGRLGKIGCFSFYSNKVISCAEGGAITTDDDDLATRIRTMRSHGMTALAYDKSKGHSAQYDVKGLGFNYRLDDIRSSLLLAQMNKLSEITEKRRLLREAYNGELCESRYLSIPFFARAERSSNYIYPVVLKSLPVGSRDRLVERLKDRGIETSVHYPPVHKFDVYRSQRAALPKTDDVADNEITLPLHSRMTMRDVQYVSAALKEELGKI